MVVGKMALYHRYQVEGFFKCGTGHFVQSKAVWVGIPCRFLKRYLGDLERGFTFLTQHPK